MPKVSVIIACYNHGQYIDQAVDSILNQTFQDFEIIIVNDGSTDEFTINKLKNYSKPKTTVFQTENKGLAAARNYGINYSSGKYILPIDADDFCDKTYIEKLLCPIEKDESIGIVSSYIQNFGTNDNIWKTLGGSVKDFLIDNRICGSSLFPRFIWQECNGYDETIKGYPDWELWINITKRGYKVYIITEILYFYRQYNNSMISRSNKIRPEIIRHIVRNHKEIFCLYIDDIIYEKEKLIQFYAQELIQKENEIIRLEKIHHQTLKSFSYRLGKFLIFPAIIIKKLLNIQ